MNQQNKELDVHNDKEVDVGEYGDRDDKELDQISQLVCLQTNFFAPKAHIFLD